MPQVKLGNKSFDEDAEQIDANNSRFSDADCAALGAAMAAGKFKRLKKLILVSLYFCYMCHCDVCFAACFVAVRGDRVGCRAIIKWATKVRGRWAKR